MDRGAMARRPLVALDGGTSYHHFALNDPAFAGRIDRLVPLRGLQEGDLADAATVLVPCRSNPDLLTDRAPLLRAVLDRGDRLVVLGESEVETWLPGLRFQPVETNFWWWLDRGADLGLRVVAPDHPLFRHVHLEDATWHYHGLFEPPAGARSLIDAPDGGSILYEDGASFAGTLVVTSLDPVYHHGSYFMPAASRFLAGLLTWLDETT